MVRSDQFDALELDRKAELDSAVNREKNALGKTRQN
jgi:hypothetical protein